MDVEQEKAEPTSEAHTQSNALLSCASLWEDIYNDIQLICNDYEEGK